MTEEAIRTFLYASIALAALVGAFFFFRWSPKMLMAVWALTLFLIPIWVGVQAGVFYSAITVITILVIATSTLKGARLSIVDLLLLTFTVLLIAARLLGWITWGHLLIALVGWMVPYLGGRLISSRVAVEWIHTCLAGGAVVASLLAIVEFLTGFNFFVLLRFPNGIYTTWGTLQYRGGLLRVEGAFGHSIALGATLAMCSVFILVARWPLWLRVVSLLVVAIATGLTFSRIGLIGLAITVVVSLILLRREITRALRTAVTVIMAVAAIIGIPLLVDVFTEAGQEAAGSAEYRTDLLSLVHDMSPLGITSSWDVLPNGETYYGSFQSIDSELILTGLRFGLIPLLLIIAALVCCLIAALRGRATPSSIALIGQIPAFATVALITQYASVAWFVAGLAVATYQTSPGIRFSEVPLVASREQHREEQLWLS
ncbi:hypothetical protein OSC27_12230 [Microbacterium sp. STN6]|uniref:hypothetical protein n=1 Tax=Microbacterium sp. STN6 TaxID=2995588 RepID=UPI002260BCC2|nr:hypothetical protein [Microbacterium sp. STN6]MCX7523041.1 hypothetical protein [Microbacterium sp. STN6]